VLVEVEMLVAVLVEAAVLVDVVVPVEVAEVADRRAGSGRPAADDATAGPCRAVSDKAAGAVAAVGASARDEGGCAGRVRGSVPSGTTISGSIQAISTIEVPAAWAATTSSRPARPNSSPARRRSGSVAGRMSQTTGAHTPLTCVSQSGWTTRCGPSSTGVAGRRLGISVPDG